MISMVSIGNDSLYFCIFDEKKRIFAVKKYENMSSQNSTHKMSRYVK